MRIVRYADSDGNIGFAMQKSDDSLVELEGGLFTGFRETERELRPSLILSPVQHVPVIGVALNYKKHAVETGKEPPAQPTLFMKLPGSIQHPGGPIQLPRTLRSDKVDFEGELAVVIGRPCRSVRSENALEYVLGYTCANDVSARDWQYEKGGGQFCRGKMFDTFCPFGPVLATPQDIPDPQALEIRTLLNGEEMQRGSTADMIFSVAELISFISGSTTLMPGTVILTGTPAGVGMAREPQAFLKPGDVVEVEIEGIGSLINKVVEESA